jgi:hypothetical protein
MSTGSLPQLPPHIAALASQRLARAGLLSIKQAQRAASDCDVRAQISTCGRKARLLRPENAEVLDNAPRSSNATAVRKAIQDFLHNQAPGSSWREITHQHANRWLTRAKINIIFQQQVATYIRMSKKIMHKRVINSENVSQNTDIGFKNETNY